MRFLLWPALGVPEQSQAVAFLEADSAGTFRRALAMTRPERPQPRGYFLGAYFTCIGKGGVPFTAPFKIHPPTSAGGIDTMRTVIVPSRLFISLASAENFWNLALKNRDIVVPHVNNIHAVALFAADSVRNSDDRR